MDFNYLRRNALFNPVQPSTGINPNALSITPDMMSANGLQQGQQPQPPNPSTLTDAYREMMQAKSGPSNQRYKDFLSEDMPKRDDFKPTKMNRLSAILAGASDGIQRGGGAGYETAQRILDEPYSEAIGDYNNRAKRLESGANLEDKETNNKVKTYRDFVTDRNNDQRNQIALGNQTETKRVNDARIANYQSQSETRETPAQRMERALGVQKSANEGRVSSAKNIFDYERGPKLQDAKTIASIRSDNSLRNQNAKFESIKDLKQYVADNVSPDKYEYHVNKDGFLTGVNKADPTDVKVTDIQTGKLPPDQLAALKLKNAKDLKAASGPGKKTTTKTTVSGNERTTETTTIPESGSKEQVKPIPNDASLEAFSTDGGKTWKARKKTK